MTQSVKIIIIAVLVLLYLVVTLGSLITDVFAPVISSKVAVKQFEDSDKAFVDMQIYKKIQNLWNFSFPLIIAIAGVLLFKNEIFRNFKEEDGDMEDNDPDLTTSENIKRKLG